LKKHPYPVEAIHLLTGAGVRFSSQQEFSVRVLMEGLNNEREKLINRICLKK